MMTFLHIVDPAFDRPDTAQIATRYPARPLFIGWKSALPAHPVFVGHVTAETARDALASIFRFGRHGADSSLSAWGPTEESGDDASSRLAPVFDGSEDWANQIHAGRRFLRHGTVDPAGGSDAR